MQQELPEHQELPEYRFTLRGAMILTAISCLSIALIVEGVAVPGILLALGVMLAIAIFGWGAGFCVTGTVPGAIQGATIFVYTLIIIAAVVSTRPLSP